MIFNYAQKRRCGQPRTELPPAVSKMPTFMLGSHTLTIRNGIKLLLQLLTPPCSFHPSPSSCPSCSRLTLSLILGWYNMGLVFVTEKFLKLTTDLPPSPTGEGEPKKTGPAPDFPRLCSSVADPPACLEQHIPPLQVPIPGKLRLGKAV